MDGFLIVFGLDSQDSFKQLKEFHEAIMKFVRDDRIPIVIVGTRSDLPRQVQEIKGKEFAQFRGASYMEVSAKTGENVQQVRVLNPCLTSKVFELLVTKIRDVKRKVI